MNPDKIRLKVGQAPLQILTVIIVIVLATAYGGVLRPLNAAIELAKVELDQKQRKLQANDSSLTRWNEVYHEYQLMQQAVVNFKQRLPQAAEIPLVMEQLDISAQKAGTVVQKLSPGNPAYGKKFGYVPIRLNMVGSYDQIVASLGNLQDLPFPVDIQSVTLGAESDTVTGRASVVSADVLIGVLLDQVKGGALYGR